MKSQFPRAWLPHSSRVINQIAGGSDPLLNLLNLEICEIESYISDAILRIPLYCKFLMTNDRCIWLKIVTNFKYNVKLFCIVYNCKVIVIVKLLAQKKLPK